MWETVRASYVQDLQMWSKKKKKKKTCTLKHFIHLNYISFHDDQVFLQNQIRGKAAEVPLLDREAPSSCSWITGDSVRKWEGVCSSVFKESQSL